MKIQLAALGLVLSLAGSLDAESFRAEQYRQRERIEQGVRSGELTRREAARLYDRHSMLNREYARDRRDGGGLSWAERRKLSAEQDRLSRSIYRQKHDWQVR